MTAISIKSLKPGELVIRRADGTLMRTSMQGFDAPARHDRAQPLLRKLIAMKRSRRK